MFYYFRQKMQQDTLECHTCTTESFHLWSRIYKLNLSSPSTRRLTWWLPMLALLTVIVSFYRVNSDTAFERHRSHIPINDLNTVHVIFQKWVRGFHQVSKREKHLKPRGRRPSGFIVFERLETWWNPKHEFLKLLLQQKNCSLSYHLNKVSQFNYYIWEVKCA